MFERDDMDYQLQTFLEANHLGNLYPLRVEKNVTSISDLVMLLIYSKSLNVIELSSASVSELNKVMELGIEFFKQAGQVKLKHGAFFFKYTSVASLQRENWTQICLSMK